MEARLKTPIMKRLRRLLKYSSPATGSASFDRSRSNLDGLDFFSTGRTGVLGALDFLNFLFLEVLFADLPVATVYLLELSHQGSIKRLKLPDFFL